MVIHTLRKTDFSTLQLLVACSGGIDSMVLLHALYKIGVRPEVLHINYGLRGSESNEDERLVRETCDKMGLSIHVHYCSTTLIKGKSVNLQAEARAFRRKLFTEWSCQSPRHAVALAHHADDQVETFFLQLFRGSGTFGLGGMYPFRQQLLRPFLELKRKDLLAYACENNIRWREDRSNAESNYLRNRWRNVFLPALSPRHPELAENVLVLMSLFRHRQQELFQEIILEISDWEQNNRLSVERWCNFSEEQRIAFLYAAKLPVWLKDRLNKLAIASKGKKILLEKGMIQKVDSDFLFIKNDHLEIRWEYKSETVLSLPEYFSKNQIYLDAEKINGKLSLRFWQYGDRICSLGMKGSQKLSDIFKDAKITDFERQTVPILTDEKSILWIPGIKIARLAVADNTTKNILRIELVKRDL